MELYGAKTFGNAMPMRLEVWEHIVRVIHGNKVHLINDVTDLSDEMISFVMDTKQKAKDWKAKNAEIVAKLEAQMADIYAAEDESKAKPISREVVQKVIKKEGLTATMRVKAEKKPRAKKQAPVDPNQFSLF